MKIFPSQSLYSPKRPPPAPRTYSVIEVARLSGLTTNLLRVWEYRYGWPNPRRNPNNHYRVYRQWDVENAKRIAEYLAAGWSISQLLKDGAPSWPKEGTLPPKRTSQRLPASEPTNAEAGEQP